MNSLSSTNINNIPSVRIPLNADYWLNGSGSGSTIGTNMTSTQYQNMIIAMVYFLMNPTGFNNGTTSFNGSANGCVIILDLHWNYSSGNQASASYMNENITPSDQCCMAIANNSIAFWNSICTVFGVNSSGNQISTTSTTCMINTSNDNATGGGNQYTLSLDNKKNIFFELYNEPYLDNVTAQSNYPGEYSSGFAIYIQGSQSVLGTDITISDRTYAVAGMGSLYNNIRITNDCINVIILGGAENYAYFAGYNYVDYEYPNPNNFLNTYNCFTKLNDAVKGGTIPILDSIGNPDPDGSTYPNNEIGLENVIANLHPYSNDYSKFPGYMYNTSNTSTSSVPNNGNSNPALCNFLEALQNGTNPSYTSYSTNSYPSPYYPAPTSQNCSSFQISFPIICTEFGMYNLPWINSSGTTTYTSAYNNDTSFTLSQSPSSNWAGTQSTIGTSYYWGEYYDADGNVTSTPCIVGYFENFNTFNVSYTIWTLIPNIENFNQNSVSQVNYSYSGMQTTTLPLLVDYNMTNIREGQNGFDMYFCFQKYYLNNYEVEIVEPQPPQPSYPWSGGEIKGYYYWPQNYTNGPQYFAGNITNNENQYIASGYGGVPTDVQYINTVSGTFNYYGESIPAGAFNSIFLFSGYSNVSSALNTVTTGSPSMFNTAYNYLTPLGSGKYLIGLVLGGGNDSGAWNLGNDGAIYYIYEAVTTTGNIYSYTDSGGNTMFVTGTGLLDYTYNCLVFDIENYSTTASQSSDFENLFTYIKTNPNSTFYPYEMVIIVTMAHSISVYGTLGGDYLADLYKSNTYDYISPQIYTQNVGTTNEYCGTGICMWSKFQYNSPTFIDNLTTNNNFSTYGLNMILPSINLSCLYTTAGSNVGNPANLYWYQNTSSNYSSPTYAISGYQPIANTFDSTSETNIVIDDVSYNQYTSNYTDNGSVNFFNTIFDASGQTLGGYAQWVNGTLTVNGTTYS